MRRILVVDDEESIRRMFVDAFRNEYEVVTAENGEEALDLLGRENILVLFIDLRLPGMDGLELCKQIRQFHPLAQIHAITGYNSLFELVDCRHAGFDDYFTKPLRLANIMRAANDAFKKLERWGAA